MQLLSLWNALPMPLYSLDKGYMPPFIPPKDPAEEELVQG